MNGKQATEHYSETETARRRDAALRRALSTPPQPHSATKTKRSTKKRAAHKKSR